MNNNQSLIDGLRKAADLLESKPDMPALGKQRISLYLYSKDDLREAARHFGSFSKHFTDHYFELIHPINEVVSLEAYIPRETICKKIVTWDCPDDESLLRLVENAAVSE